MWWDSKHLNYVFTCQQGQTLPNTYRFKLFLPIIPWLQHFSRNIGILQRCIGSLDLEWSYVLLKESSLEWHSNVNNVPLLEMLKSSFDPPLQKSDRLVSRCARWNFQTLPKWWTGWKPWLLALNLVTMCERCAWQWAGFYALQTIKNTATNQNASSNETANERLSNSGQPVKTTMTS